MVITQVKTGIAEMSSWLSTRPFKKSGRGGGGSRKEVFVEMVVPVQVCVHDRYGKDCSVFSQLKVHTQHAFLWEEIMY